MMKEQKNVFSTRRISMVGLMAALVIVGSWIRITIPISIGGTTEFHLGNIMCALSGILLGPWFGGIASGVGSAIFDLLNPLHAAEFWITFLLKGAYGLIAGLIAWSGNKRAVYWKDLLASVCAALTYAVMYLAKSYIIGGLLSGEQPLAAWVIVLNKLPATVFNAVIAVVFAPVLAAGIRSSLKKSHIRIE